MTPLDGAIGPRFMTEEEIAAEERVRVWSERFYRIADGLFGVVFVLGLIWTVIWACTR